MTILSNIDSLSRFGPELVLLAGCLLLFPLSILLQNNARRDLLLTLAALIFLGSAEVLVWNLPPEPASLFNNMIGHDAMATFFKHIFLLAAAITVIIAAPYMDAKIVRLGEFYALLMATTLGMFLMASATDLLMAYIAVELVSLSSYVLTGFKKGDRKANEGALKYVIYGGVASGVMLFGMSYLYGMTGTTTLIGPSGIGAGMTELARQLFVQRAFGGHAAAELALIVAVVFVLAGIGYKIASVPFHMWCPDVYEAAYTPFTAFLSVGPKAAGFALAIRFFYGTFVTTTTGPEGMLFHVATNFPWPAIIGVISAVTMTLGNLAAIPQTNLKRLLAYSSIAHAGYLLMGLAAVSVGGVQSVMVYLVIYLFMNLGAFLVVIMVARVTGSESIFEFRGLSSRAPLAAITFAIFLFSLTGIPPFAGFTGKYLLFAALLHEGGWYWALALIGAVNSAISLYYYARIVRAMFLDKPFTEAPLSVPALYNVLAVALVIPIFVFGLYWGPLANWTLASFKLLGQ